jgi:hypothetical protein
MSGWGQDELIAFAAQVFQQHIIFILRSEMEIFYAQCRVRHRRSPGLAGGDCSVDPARTHEPWMGLALARLVAQRPFPATRLMSSGMPGTRRSHGPAMLMGVYESAA